jgi:hypothetical protein
MPPYCVAGGIVGAGTTLALHRAELDAEAPSDEQEPTMKRRIVLRNLLPLILGGALACGEAAEGASGAGAAVTAGEKGGGGTGGKGASAYPAFRPPLPSVVTSGGPIMTSPRIVPVFFPSTAARDDILAYLRAYVASPAWTQQTKEYGVGAASVADPIELDADPTPTGELGSDRAEGTPLDPHTGTITNDDIRAFLAQSLDASADVWGPSDAGALSNTLFMFFYPPSVLVDYGKNGIVCLGPAGYHDAVELGDGRFAAYSVDPVCNFPGSLIDSLGSGMSHELVEGVTDPLGAFVPAYNSLPPEYIGWQLVAGGELGDMCARIDDDLPSFTARVDGVSGLVQRMWSNEQAKAYHDPCVPALPGPYFSSVPLTTVVPLSGIDRSVQGVKIAVGQSADVTLQLFSDAPTDDSWTLEARDLSAIVAGGLAPPDPSGKAKLSFALDRTSGKNGDTLKLTVRNERASNARTPFGLFEIVSKLGDRSTVQYGTVAD